jgi:lysozyme family protein/DNA-binding transcriptional regulator YdaS (Cro superfamily)
MDSRFGHDFGKVRVYTDAQAAASAHALNARAYTIGCSIVFGRNQYAPGTAEGRRLLAHELTHVIHQERNLSGARGPTIQRTVEGDITHMSITPEWAHNLTDKELVEQKRIVQLQISQQRGDIDAARTNLGILNNEHNQPLRKLERKDDKAAFQEWWKPVPEKEGTLEQHQSRTANVLYDKGGPTNLGVTWDMYKKYAKVLLRLEPTEENFKNMNADQAMLFGRMIWKSSGATAIQNTGVAFVLADWAWGGINRDRLSALLAKKGYKASYDQGKPTEATIDFMNTLSPSELVDLMSDEKAAQYRAFAKAHPEQQVFTKGQVNRSEERRQQARPFTISIHDVGQRALAEAETVLQKGADASSEEKSAAKNTLWAVVGRIEQQQKMGLSDAEAQPAMRNLKVQLLNRIGKVMDLGT